MGTVKPIAKRKREGGSSNSSGLDVAPAMPCGVDISIDAQRAELDRRLQRSGVQSIAVDTVFASRYYNRFGLDLDKSADDNFSKLVSSIKEHGGNLVPALLLLREDGITYEVIYGHRRWAACRHVGIALNAFVIEGLDGQEVARYQLIENTGRKDPSIIDRAKQIFSQLEVGAWKGGQTTLAKTLGVGQSYVSQLNEIGKHMPGTVQMVHPDHHKITFRQARSICELAQKEPAELKSRMEWVRKRKTGISAEEATNYLIAGQSTSSRDGPRIHWTVSKAGLTLKARGLTQATAAKLSERIEQLMVELGLPVDNKE